MSKIYITIKDGVVQQVTSTDNRVEVFLIDLGAGDYDPHFPQEIADDAKDAFSVYQSEVGT